MAALANSTSVPIYEPTLSVETIEHHSELYTLMEALTALGDFAASLTHAPHFRDPARGGYNPAGDVMYGTMEFLCIQSTRVVERAKALPATTPSEMAMRARTILYYELRCAHDLNDVSEFANLAFSLVSARPN